MLRLSGRRSRRRTRRTFRRAARDTRGKERAEPIVLLRSSRPRRRLLLLRRGLVSARPRRHELAEPIVVASQGPSSLGCRHTATNHYTKRVIVLSNVLTRCVRTFECSLRPASDAQKCRALIYDRRRGRTASHQGQWRPQQRRRSDGGRRRSQGRSPHWFLHSLFS